MERVTRDDFLRILKTPPEYYIQKTYIEETNGGGVKEQEIICFKDVIFKDFQINEDISIERYISFNNTQFDNVTIKGLRTTKSIRFSNIRSEIDDFTLEVGAKQLIFDGSTKFESRLNIIRSNLEYLSFSNIQFTNQITIENCDIRKVILSANFHAVFFGENTIDELRANGGEIKEFHLKSGNTRSLLIHDPIILKHAFVRGGDIGCIYINSLWLEKFDVKSDNGKQDNLKINTIEIVNTGKNNSSLITSVDLKRLHFKDSFASRDSIFRVNGIILEDLQFLNFTNYGQINLTNVSISNSLSFSSSDIGKLSFISCSLENAFLDFSKSKIIETFIIGSDFPTKFKEGNSEEDKVEAYGQIKKIYESRGAQKNVLEYYSLEMNALAATKAVKKNFWERTNLYLNGFSTNHGVSWEKGLCTTFLVSVGFYTLYILSLGVYTVNPSKLEYWKELGKVLSYYFEFINPVHVTNVIAEKLGFTSTSISRIIEGFSRIFIAYFIYQLIQAFRKHGKK